jgi:hypothetical protein
MTYVGSSIKYTPIGYLAFVEQDISGVAVGRNRPLALLVTHSNHDSPLQVPQRPTHVWSVIIQHTDIPFVYTYVRLMWDQGHHRRRSTHRFPC